MSGLAAGQKRRGHRRIIAPGCRLGKGTRGVGDGNPLRGKTGHKRLGRGAKRRGQRLRALAQDQPRQLELWRAARALPLRRWQ